MNEKNRMLKDLITSMQCLHIGSQALSTPPDTMTFRFTCISCRVTFADADLQRGHYKTDWHRYNLKRKVAELPPVTAENFRQRVLTLKDEVRMFQHQNLEMDILRCFQNFDKADFINI